MRYERSKWSFMLAGLIYMSSSQAEVTLDGTVGRSGSLPGPNYAITADLGQQVGGNLFHSFGQFSIHTGESAIFSGPNSVTNIIGRVTGGQLSTIDGTLRSTIPGANLYLLNPSGMLFGEHATLDVPGSVHISTADYLRLSDGGRFDARTPANSILTIAPVAAFGFLGDAPGSIEINGSFLRVPEGQTLSLIGGDVTLTHATVYAPAGRINVAAVASGGEVIPTEADLAMQDFALLGTLTLEGNSADLVMIDLGAPFGEVPLGNIDVSGAGAGAIFIRAGQWISRGGIVFADTYGDRDGYGINAIINGDMQLENGTVLAADSVSAHPGGDITLTVAGTLSLLNGGIIGTRAWDVGDAGSITVNAPNLRVDGRGSSDVTTISSMAEVGSIGGAGGQINLTITDTVSMSGGGQITASTVGAGDAGSVTVNAGNLLVDGQTTLIASTAEPDSTGAGGQINLMIADTVSIVNGGQIFAGTFSSSRGGVVTLNAGNLLIDRQSSAIHTGIFSTAQPESTGTGGDINLVVTDTITILNGGRISASTFGLGSGGRITINIGGATKIDGGIIVDNNFIPSGLYARAYDLGNAGDITLTTPSLTLSNGGGIFATSDLSTGGTLLINADHLKLFNGSQISTSVFGDLTTQGGNVEINGINLVALDGSKVTATATKGLGGVITVNTDVFLHNALSIGSVLDASSGTMGNDGTVALNAPTTDISGSLVALSAPYLDAAAQLRPDCGAVDEEHRSRFTVHGRGGLPLAPDEVLATSVEECH